MAKNSIGNSGIRSAMFILWISAVFPYFPLEKTKKVLARGDLTTSNPTKGRFPQSACTAQKSLSAGTETGSCGTEEFLHLNVSILRAFRCQTLSGIDCLSQLILTSDAFQVGGRSLHSVSHQHSLTTGMWCQFVPSVQRRKEVWI